MTVGVAYNERSWAIDLIGHIKIVVSSNNHSIKDAGGEQTVKSEGGSVKYCRDAEVERSLT